MRRLCRPLRPFVEDRHFKGARARAPLCTRCTRHAVCAGTPIQDDWTLVATHDVPGTAAQKGPQVVVKVPAGLIDETFVTPDGRWMALVRT